MKGCRCWKSRFAILVFSVLSLLCTSSGVLAESNDSQGKVTAISKRSIEIDLGRTSGLQEGTQLKVVRNQEIKRKDVVIKTEQVEIGAVEVVTLEENTATVKMIRSYRPIQADDIILLPPGLHAVKAAAKPEIAANVVEQKAEVKVEATTEPVPVAPAQPEPTVGEAVPAPESKSSVEEVKPVEPTKKEPPAVEVKTEEEAKSEAKEEAKAEEKEKTKVETKAEEPVAPAPAPEPVPVAKPQVKVTGELAITTEPADAELYMDKKHLGTTPKTVFDLEAKKYQIQITKGEYNPWSGEVQIVAGQAKKLEVTLKRFEGSLQVNSMPPEAQLIVDGKAMGQTNARVYLKPGDHTLSLKKDGYKPLEKKINLTEDKPQTLNLVLDSIGGPEVANMVYIPKGDFAMGTNSGLMPHESPKHTVKVDGFYIDKHEVTNAEYREFVKATKHNPPGFWHDKDLNKPDQPVVGVSWNDAMAYAKWAGKRLPTEAEWEKAARGSDGRIYPWGNEKNKELANGAGKADGYEFTAPAVSFHNGASPYGVLNMAGNVWEWCADWYGKNYYADSPADNPQGPSAGRLKVLRGGAWDAPIDSLTTTNRYAEPPTFWNNNVGFRCAK